VGERARAREREGGRESARARERASERERESESESEREREIERELQGELPRRRASSLASLLKHHTHTFMLDRANSHSQFRHPVASSITKHTAHIESVRPGQSIFNSSGHPLDKCPIGLSQMNHTIPPGATDVPLAARASPLPLSQTTPYSIIHRCHTSQPPARPLAPHASACGPFGPRARPPLAYSTRLDGQGLRAPAVLVLCDARSLRARLNSLE